jgi:hypothetical protein
MAFFKRHWLTAKIYGFRKGKVIKDRIVCLLGRENKGWMEYHYETEDQENHTQSRREG